MPARRFWVIFGVSLYLLSMSFPSRVIGQGTDPQAVRQAVEKGRRLLKEWEIEEARNQFEKARIASNDQAAAPFVGLAEVELKLDNLERALQYVDKALELVRDPKSKAEILNLKGLVSFGYVARLPASAAAPGAEAQQPEGKGSGTLTVGEAPLDLEAALVAGAKQNMRERGARAAVAEKYFREALELSGGSLNAARLNLAEALQRQWKVEEGRRWIDEYLSHAGKDDDTTAARSLLCWLRGATFVTPPGEDEKLGKVTPPERIKSSSPKYTRQARKNRTEGVVIAEGILDEQGNVECVRVVRGLPDGLSDSAVKSLKQWKFKPATIDGKPVRVYYNLSVSFHLGA